MKQVLSIISVFLLIVLVIAIIFGAALGIVLLLLYGMTRLLIWLFAFSFFEAMLLSGVVYAGMWFVLQTAANFFGLSDIKSQLPGKRKDGNGNDDDDDDDNSDRVYKRIAPSRFYSRPAERTWNAWLQEEIANDIYIEFQDDPPAVSKMSDSQREELAIRLGDIAVNILKRKSGRSPNLQVSLQDFKREMPKLGQRPYDDDILQLAVAGTNLNLDYYHDEIIEVVRGKNWEFIATVDKEDE